MLSALRLSESDSSAVKQLAPYADDDGTYVQDVLDLTMRLMVEEGPALACIRVPVGCRVRNMRPMYQGIATVTSGSLHETSAWPSKN